MYSTKLGGIIKPRQLNRFWHRRICEAIILVALILGGLFIWSFVGGITTYNKTLAVPLIPGITAIVTLAVTLLAYFLSPVNKKGWAAMGCYLLLILTLALTVITTGGITSTFFSLLVISIIFAPFFGGTSLLVVAFVLAGFTAWVHYIDGVALRQLIAPVAVSFVPLVAGLLVWGRAEAGKPEETAEDRSYNELASELSQVAGKSEVVINAITDGVLALDSQGMIQLINPAAQQLVGWGKHDALNLTYKSVLQLVNSKNAELTDIEDPVSQVLSTNKALKNDELSVKTQAGKTFLAAISVSPVGRLGSGVIVVFRDITSEKSDERQRAEFISTASHEMRTPVASIEGYLGLALNPSTAQIDAKARDFINKAHESAQHLGRLFQDLLDVSKADDSRLQNNPSVVDVVPFVNEIVQGLIPKAKEKGLRVLYKPMPEGNEEADHRINPVYYVNVDNDHFREVIDNLVENAIKYTPQGEVIIDVSGDDTHAVISVKDTGVGIPREDQGHLFQKFYRVDSSETRSIGGTGLGLYLCRRLSETMGGRIWVESEYKKGSTFYLELPRIDHDEATQLIEQASILAEQRAVAEEQRVLRDAQKAQQTITPAQPQVFTPATPTPQAQTINVVQAPAQPTPVIQPSTPTTTPNTPLSTIEANPAQYTGRRETTGLTVPKRQQ